MTDFLQQYAGGNLLSIILRESLVLRKLLANGAILKIHPTMKLS